MRSTFIILLIASLFLFSGCNKDEFADIQDYIDDKGLTGFTSTPEGLFIKMDNPGTQQRPNLGSIVKVHYKGTLTNGDKFDSSYDRGNPIDIALTNTIQGWQIGIPKFGVGGKGTLIIPPSLGYGKSGSGSIPGDAIIIFEIELINFQ